ncbi:LiaI-LiaF-like domain-containing protein [Sphingobacterium cellulitidis]|uniref:LiaI-LiaF-like domain-containing protein n=1 Tax=Sphingobacterium cellulitidis TaxID=1768011 RepID=UPI003C7B26E8
MNNKIATGIWLVFAGLVFLLHNMKVIDFNFYGIINLWPLILVSIGISLLLQGRTYSKYIVIASNIILCGIIFFKGITSKDTFYDRLGNIEVNTGDDIEGPFTQVVSQNLSEDTETAKLTINGGAAKYNFSAGKDSSLILDAKTAQATASLNLQSKGEKNVSMELTSKMKNNKYNNSLIEVALNTKPLWDLEFNVGAAAITGDFKQMRIGKLEVNSGASSLNLYLPKPSDGVCDIEVNTAASKVILYLPKGAACQVETDALFSNNKYEDVDVVIDDVRKSKNFDQETNKYDIKVAGAANSLSILRY